MSTRLTCVCTVLLGCVLSAQAQTPDPAPAPWSIGEIKFSGLIDGYYSHNFNNPASGYNTLRNFEVKSRQFSLNMVEFSMFHDPEPIGFRLDLGFGRAWDVFHATDPAGRDIVRFFPQAFVSAKPKGWGGLQFDFGKFYTSAGAELTENNQTWTYGRGYLYTNGPYYHQGLRITKPIAGTFSAGFQLVNGWNNVEDNNSGKTIGLTTAWTGKKISWFNNVYLGPEKTANNIGWRNFYDTVLNITPSDKFAAYINYDHGVENKADGTKKGSSADWDAIGLAGHFTASDHTSFTARYEYYGDHDGFATGYGSELKLQSFTATYEYKWMQGLLSRFEYRHDWSDKGFFERGSIGQPLNPGIGTFTPGTAKSQDTLTFGMVAFFGPK